MPAVAVAIAGAAVSAGVTAITTGAFIGWSAFALNVFGSVALSFLQGGLSKKKKPSVSSFDAVKSSGLTQQFSQAVSEHRLIYGEARVSGPVIFPATSEENKYFHIVILLANHEVEEIGEILVDDESIPPDAIDGSGFVTTGQYANKIRIKKHLGGSGQVADSTLVAEVPEWTSNHIGNECAYIYVRMEWDRDVFPSNIPNVSAWVKGKKILDPRDSTTKWTPNLALIARDYLIDTKHGLKTETSAIDLDQLETSANICEEFVSCVNEVVNVTAIDTSTNILTLAGSTLTLQTGDKVQLSSGTIGGLSPTTDYYVIVYQRKTTPRIKLTSSIANCFAGTAIDITSGTTGQLTKIAEPRYLGGGVLLTSAERGNNLREIYTSMAGQCVFAGGVWRILAGAYQTPTISFGLDDIIGSIEVDPWVTKADVFNRVQGIYTSPKNDGNPSDYPFIENSTYQTDDGEIIKTDLDQPFTQRALQAQRIAKIYMERMRQEIVFRARFDIVAMKVQVGDNFYLTIDRYGWTNKVFEVIDWTLGIEGDGTPYIEMSCRENASAAYDWNSGEETTVDPAPNTSLPNPFSVGVVVGFSLDSIPVYTQAEDRIFNVLATWDPPENYFVLSGGRFEVQYKESDQTVYKSHGFVDGGVTELRLTSLQPDTLYDIRIFAYNSLGVRSAATEITNFLVGTTVTTNTEDWENETLPRDGDDWETDTLTSEDWET